MYIVLSHRWSAPLQWSCASGPRHWGASYQRPASGPRGPREQPAPAESVSLRCTFPSGPCGIPARLPLLREASQPGTFPWRSRRSYSMELSFFSADTVSVCESSIWTGSRRYQQLFVWSCDQVSPKKATSVVFCHLLRDSQSVPHTPNTDGLYSL